MTNILMGVFRALTISRRHYDIHGKKEQPEGQTLTGIPVFPPIFGIGRISFLFSLPLPLAALDRSPSPRLLSGYCED